MTRQRLTTLAVALGVAITAAPAALAGGGPAGDQYPSAPKLLNNVAPAAHGVAPITKKAVKSSGTLPFTGLDLGLVAALGGSALIGGVGLRRLGRKRSDT
ncbi:MAG: hypothetical protein ACRDM1_10950 [Gaiellaceae bacterium]